MRNSYIRQRTTTTDVLLVLFFMLSVAIMTTNALMGYPSKLNNVVAALSLLVSVYLCYVYRHNIGLFLVMMFIAYTNYSVVVGVYFEPMLRPSFMYDQFLNSVTFGIDITCIYLFELVTLWMSRSIIKNPQCISSWKNAANGNYEYNNVIAIFAPIIYVLLFALNFRIGESGDRGSSSAINEYRTIIAIIGCYYCGRKNIYKWIWTIIIGITCLLIMLSGNRVDMFGSAIFLIVFWYADYANYKKVLLLLPVAVVILAAVGFMRGGFSLINLDIGETIGILFEDRLTYEGAIYGYVPSLATIELSKTTGETEKLKLFWQHIKYIFTFGVAGASNPDLSKWSRNYYVHYWGFISPAYFYFWFGYLGPVLFATLVNVYNRFYQKSIVKKVCKFSEKLYYILSLYFITNVGRWYAYGPMGLLRSMFVCTVAFCIVYAFDLFVRQRSDRFRRGY